MTSSAVVGSSPMTMAGSQASAIAIIARWRIPPDSWWGYASPALPRDADEFEQVARSLARGLRRLAEPLLDRFGDLVADPADRIEGVHRALEHDADLAPSIAPQRVLGLGHEVDAHQVDAARHDLRVGRQDAARATAPSSSCRSPTRRRSRAPRHASSRNDTPSTAWTVPDLDREMGPQVVDHEQRRRRVRQLGQRPLRVASRPS